MFLLLTCIECIEPVEYIEHIEPVSHYFIGNCHSVRIPATGFKPSFLACLSRPQHKRLFQKLPKTRLAYRELFYNIKLGQLGSFYAYVITC